jgi:hypothetical protein
VDDLYGPGTLDRIYETARERYNPHARDQR